jgi:hypothetical protein
MFPQTKLPQSRASPQLVSIHEGKAPLPNRGHGHNGLLFLESKNPKNREKCKFEPRNSAKAP